MQDEQVMRSMQLVRILESSLHKFDHVKKHNAPTWEMPKRLSCHSIAQFLRPSHIKHRSAHLIQTLNPEP